jgi:serine/threonine-protein kinase RsbW
LPSNPEILSVVRNAMMRLSRELGFPARECRALTRAVDEALANIICHAYGGRKGQPIELSCRRMHARRSGNQRASLEIVLVDRGAAADRKKLRGRSLDDVRPGGLGLHFIQGGVDVMQYRSQGAQNRLRLVKYLPAAKSQPQIAKGNWTVEISARRMDKTTILDISGDIDLAHSSEVRRIILLEFREKRTPRVILNLLKVNYIDSSGVASLVEGLKASRDVG